MNLWEAVKQAELCFEQKKIKEARALIDWAEKILAQRKSTRDLPLICCFEFDGQVLHCGKKGKKLFAGTLEKRIRLCQNCQETCKKKIKKLKSKLN